MQHNGRLATLMKQERLNKGQSMAPWSATQNCEPYPGPFDRLISALYTSQHHVRRHQMSLIRGLENAAKGAVVGVGLIAALPVFGPVCSI